MSQLYDKQYQTYVQSNFAGESVSKAPWSIIPHKVLDTVEKVKEAITYAEYRVQHRRVTPRTKTFLQHYQRTLTAFLNDRCPRREGQVEALNDVFHSKAMLHKELHPLYQVEMNAVVKLAENRYFADYGDYAAAECLHFRERCSEQKVASLEQVTGKNWTGVQAELNAEELTYRKWIREGGIGESPVMPLTTVIASACAYLRIDRQTIHYCIQFYAKRNENAHCGVSTYIKNLDWERLGPQIWQDLRNIPSILGEEDQAKMRRTIETIRDRYFCIIDQSPENQLISSYAQRLTDVKRVKKEREDDRKRQEMEDAAKKAKETADKQREWEVQKEEGRQEHQSGGKRRERASKPSTDSFDAGEDFDLGF